MFLSHLTLFQFRNHREAEFALGAQVNCFTGPNGVGKTNLLDAVHYLSLTKSYFEPTDTHNVLRGEEVFMVKGTMATDAGDDELVCSVKLVVYCQYALISQPPKVFAQRK